MWAWIKSAAKLATGAAGTVAAPYLTYIKIGAVVVLATLIGGLYLLWRSAENRADDLRLENDRKQSQIDALNAAAKFQKNAIGALERDAAATAARDEISDKIKEDIGNALPADDAPVAPVLDRTLDVLDRLRRGAPH